MIRNFFTSTEEKGYFVLVHLISEEDALEVVENFERSIAQFVNAENEVRLERKPPIEENVIIPLLIQKTLILN